MAIYVFPTSVNISLLANHALRYKIHILYKLLKKFYIKNVISKKIIKNMTDPRFGSLRSDHARIGSDVRIPPIALKAAAVQLRLFVQGSQPAAV